MSLYDDVYGSTYAAAIERQSILNSSIKERIGHVFEDRESCEAWAKEHLLDVMVYLSMSHKYLHVSHRGEVLTQEAFRQLYGSVLQYKAEATGKGGKPKEDIYTWVPSGYELASLAKITSERSDGIHQPLYHRNYFTPTGSYDYASGTFNVAKPSTVFARDTGTDISYVYEYIKHVGMECSMHLLAWLRAKLLYPTVKTQVVVVLISKSQGSGKSTFGEVICKALFGADNVLVTDQYDSQSRFNADYADALVVCQEEKEETDKRNPASAIKSRATATTIRKELKGVDPVYQESYTDFIITTNKDVPIKFDGKEDQRRFMVINTDEHFTRKESELADEVFTKLYGCDANNMKVGVPFIENTDAIAQFKHDLFSNPKIADVKLREFPHTAAYNRCYSLPRTSENVEIDSLTLSLVPFIQASLKEGKLVDRLEDGTELSSVALPHALLYVREYEGKWPAYVAVCRPIVYSDASTGRAMQHAVVERALYNIRETLRRDYGIDMLDDMGPIPGGFRGIQGRNKLGPAAKFCEYKEEQIDMSSVMPIELGSPPQPATAAEREGARLGVNAEFKVDPGGCFETVNEMPSGTTTLKDKGAMVLYRDTFLLESDDASRNIEDVERKRAEEYADTFGAGMQIDAEKLYEERLLMQRKEAEKLYKDGKVLRVVYSGAKSVHLLVRVSDAPNDNAEYKWLHAYLCTLFAGVLNFDASTADPARLTRAPRTLRRETEAYGLKVVGTQRELFAEKPRNVLDVKWRELYKAWQERPCEAFEKHGKKLVPSKPDYRKAVKALSEGSFWTDKQFNGRRQELFFPAYRLMRSIGYSHSELWSSVLLQNIDNYGKIGEIGYWKTRETCTLIQQIDADYDE